MRLDINREGIIIGINATTIIIPSPLYWTLPVIHSLLNHLLNTLPYPHYIPIIVTDPSSKIGIAKSFYCKFFAHILKLYSLFWPLLYKPVNIQL